MAIDPQSVIGERGRGTATLAQRLLAAQAMKAPSTTTPSAGLHHTQLGSSGPRIAFCHGLFGQGKNWTSIAKALADDHQVTLLDMPNHGRSAWTDHFSYLEMAVAVGDKLSELGGDEPFTVVGHSMGGKVAMALALQRPTLVQRLCVVDIAPVRYAGLSNFADYVTAMRALDLDHLRDRQAADLGLQPLVPDASIRSFLLQSLRRDPYGWRWQMNLDLLGDNLDQLGDWPDISTGPGQGADPYHGSVLWLAGANSNYITAEYAAAMRTLFPQVRLVTVKNAGHWVHSEQPEVFVTAIKMFVDFPDLLE